MAARTRYAWVKFMECDELLYGNSFPLRLKGVIYKSYVDPVLVYGCEAWSLEEIIVGLL